MFGIGGFSGGSKNGEHYDIEVNEGSVNMKRFSAVANERHSNGYRMAHVFMQEGNTIVVWEKVG
ncbi:hypothetical protein [Longivirga aurantiaca]|uniref:Uncharacterized protein n=1 Tax=Longivirga aurantiaca TaxID=1837743 RepID=A0ABW1T3M0_9ACTN